MRIALLLCDHVKPELVHVSGDYPEMFQAMFAKHAPEVRLTVFDIQAGQYPQDIDQFDAFLSSGSASSVYEQHDWILEFTLFVRQLFAAEKKFIGICFGHQMIAHALGADVELSEKGWGVGIKKSRVVNKKPWMTPESRDFSMLLSHRDQVLSLPPNGELLACNEHCEISMFQIGKNFLGLQGHPEFTRQYAKALMQFRKNIIPLDIRQRASNTFEQSLDTQVIVSWMLRFVGNGC
ncbi:GMP synthase [Thalassotalea sp. HSM 43]|uniref:glutamine amidotransferase-related protein n=1 Tax=Thalassotalea sp. HSM 43 TaxID=2552945 RepID=UPI001080FCCD|nr:GMP synthase [Thalassotalea sp. HSM 43]QBY03267.1 GMP synthase [Thalassotalea sp. HSM 43]